MTEIPSIDSETSAPIYSRCIRDLKVLFRSHIEIHDTFYYIRLTDVHDNGKRETQK